MERIEAISEGEWNCLNGIFSEEAEFMAQLLRNCSLPNEVQNDTNIPVSSMFWLSNGNISGVDESAMYSSDETNTSTYSFSQGSGSCLPFPSNESFCPIGSHQVFVDKNDYMTMDYCMMEDKNNSCQAHAPDVMGRDELNLDVSNVSIQSNNNMCEDVLQGKEMEVGKVLAIPSPWESKKRSRIPGEFQRKKRSVKVPRVVESNEDNNNNSNAFVVQRQKSSSCCSEDESNSSHEVNGVTSSSSSKGSRALNLDGKTRASRGSATDPQSLYARKRRERINERLRILQKLVPNGTKVDISTMLEEAVQYVKFLQLQIKMLSSDEMWMYAPIAYNGMDIGLDLKISTPHQQS